MSILSSCGKDDVNMDDPVVPSSSASIIVESEVGGSSTFDFEASDSWKVTNNNKWFSVTPESGQSGKNTLTVTVLKANEALKERINSFKVVDGDEKRSFSVIQRGIVTVNVPKNDVYAMLGMEKIVLPVNGTYPFEDIVVASDAEWLQFSAINRLSEPALLSDGATYSNYWEGELVLDILQENNGSGPREANVSVTAGKEKFSFKVLQQSSEPSAVDYSRAFYKASAVIKFTGTWCGNCPNMSQAIHLAQDEMPGRLYLVNAHNGSAANMDWQGTEKLLYQYGITGFPTGIFNGYVELMNYSYNLLKKALVEVLDEAIHSYPADVAIAGSSVVEGNKINLSFDMASKVSGEYMLTIFFLEDGISAEQAGTGGNYIHNDVLRGAATDNYASGGNKVILSENQIKNYKVSVNVPANVADINKLKILAYVTHAGSATVQGVNNSCISYENYGWVLDNAIQIPVNGFVDFRYE